MIGQFLKNELHEGIVKFIYTEKDGSKYIAVGTQNRSILEFIFGEEWVEKLTTDWEVNPVAEEKCISFWDINDKSWRSCIEEDIIDIRGVRYIDEIVDLLNYNKPSSAEHAISVINKELINI